MTNILKISEAASIGLHAMMVLARNPEKMVSAGELSEILQVSEAHLAKVLQRLAKVDLVKSCRGPKGGFLLGKSPEQITMLEIYQAIEGPLAKVECLLHQPICKGRKCIFGNVISQINNQIVRQLSQTTLRSQILEEQK